ncbi:hypothetical protein LX88_006249 [Lentzea californiensis]|nr:hypothetical protein [Lentzea californiensis]
MTITGSRPGSRWRRALGARRQPVSGDRFPWLGLLVELAALMMVAGGALWFTFGWLARVASVKADQSAAIQGKDYVTAMLDAVKIALSIVAGGGALIALYLAMRRQRTAERDLRARLDALWGAETWLSGLTCGSSRCRFVLVDQAAEHSPTTYRSTAWVSDRVIGSWWSVVSRSVWSPVVVVRDVAVQH